MQAGDRVVSRTENGEGEVCIVISNTKPRFSGGWNKFARENHESLNETLFFTLLGDEGLVYSVDFPGSN